MIRYPTVEATLSDVDWAALVAGHRFLSLVYQNLHWLSKGSEFYGDHLLYERLYKKLVEEVDQIAERAIGLVGDQTVDLSHIIPNFEIVSAGLTMGSAIETEQALAVILQAAEQAADSLGAKDLLATLASSREEDLYLLGRRAQA
jgi:DNA-binding ferritin-like protein